MLWWLNNSDIRPLYTQKAITDKLVFTYGTSNNLTFSGLMFIDVYFLTFIGFIEQL